MMINLFTNTTITKFRVMRGNHNGQSVTEYCMLFVSVAVILIVAFRFNGPFYDAVKDVFENLRDRMRSGLLGIFF